MLPLTSDQVQPVVAACLRVQVLDPKCELVGGLDTQPLLQLLRRIAEDVILRIVLWVEEADRSAREGLPWLCRRPARATRWSRQGSSDGVEVRVVLVSRRGSDVPAEFLLRLVGPRAAHEVRIQREHPVLDDVHTANVGLAVAAGFVDEETEVPGSIPVVVKADETAEGRPWVESVDLKT